MTWPVPVILIALILIILGAWARSTHLSDDDDDPIENMPPDDGPWSNQ